MQSNFSKLICRFWLAFSLMPILIYFCLGITTAKANDIHEIVDVSKPHISADNYGGIHVAFLRWEKASNQCSVSIWYSKTHIDNTVWTDPVCVIRYPFSSIYKQLALDIAVERSGAIDIVMGENLPSVHDHISPILFSRSTDSGKTWTTPKQISSVSGATPALAIGTDDSIHVIWNSATKPMLNPFLWLGIDTDMFWNKDLYYSCSTDGGKTWSKESLLPVGNTCEAHSAAIAIDTDGVIHVASADQLLTKRQSDIYYTKKSGGAWSKPVIVSNSTLSYRWYSGVVGIACGPGSQIYISWFDTNGFSNSRDVEDEIWCAITLEPGQFAKPIHVCKSRSHGEVAFAADRTGHLAFVFSRFLGIGKQGYLTWATYRKNSVDSGEHFSDDISLPTNTDSGSETKFRGYIGDLKNAIINHKMITIYATPCKVSGVVRDTLKMVLTPL